MWHQKQKEAIVTNIIKGMNVHVSEKWMFLNFPETGNIWSNIFPLCLLEDQANVKLFALLLLQTILFSFQFYLFPNTLFKWSHFLFPDVIDIVIILLFPAVSTPAFVENGELCFLYLNDKTMDRVIFFLLKVKEINYPAKKPILLLSVPWGRYLPLHSLLLVC